MSVNTDDIKKHKNDVFRLLPLVDSTEKIETAGNVKVNVERFMAEIELEGNNHGKNIWLCKNIYTKTKYSVQMNYSSPSQHNSISWLYLFIRGSNFIPGICRIHDILSIICDIGSDTLKICAEAMRKVAAVLARADI